MILIGKLLSPFPFAIIFLMKFFSEESRDEVPVLESPSIGSAARLLELPSISEENEVSQLGTEFGVPYSERQSDTEVFRKPADPDTLLCMVSTWTSPSPTT